MSTCESIWFNITPLGNILMLSCISHFGWIRNLMLTYNVKITFWSKWKNPSYQQIFISKLKETLISCVISSIHSIIDITLKFLHAGLVLWTPQKEDDTLSEGIPSVS